MVAYPRALANLTCLAVVITCAPVKRTMPSLFAFALFWAAAAFAQSGGGHTLFGDFKVDESQAKEAKPQTFHIILYNFDGQVIGRQPIGNNGRYRFNNVRNGEYYLVVEFEGQEVARIPLILAQVSKTDIRKDITLEWRETAVARANPGAIAADTYKRDKANQPRIEKGQEAISKKDYGRAVMLLREAVEADPKDFEAWTELGTAYFANGDDAAAEAAYVRALEEKPTFAVALLNLGRLRIRQKNFEGAIEVLERTVEAHPKSAAANYFLGEAYLQIKKGSKGVVYLNEALRLDPTGMADAHLRLAALFNAAGLKDRAAAEYEQFLQKRPNHPEKDKLRRYISEHKK